MSDRSNDIRVVEFKFDIQKPPVFKEQRGKDWIQYGIDQPYRNLYPKFLIDLYNRSSKHNAIVSAKAEYVAANGWEYSEVGLDITRAARLNAFINSANPEETANDILEKVATDLEVFNGFALDIIPKKGGIGNNVYHVPFQDIRSDKDNDRLFISEDWKKSRPEFEEFDAYDWNQPNKRGILYVKWYRPGSDTYPIPSYIGAIPYILTDIEIANFHYNSIKNGFVGGTLINLLNGEPPTKEAKDEIYRDIVKKLSGSDNANSIVLNFADGKDRAAEVLPMMGNDFDKRFNILNDTVRKEVFSGHKITDPALFGIMKDGAFQNASELADSWALFQNTYIDKRQAFIENIFNSLLQSWGIDGRLKIQKVEPVSVSLSETVVTGVMTEDEIRERAGLPIVEKQEGEIDVDSKAKDAQSALRGSVGGVTGIITVLQNVQAGVIGRQSAIELLIQLYGFTPEQAVAVVGGDTSAIAPDSEQPLIEPSQEQFHEKSWSEVKVAKRFHDIGYSLEDYEIVDSRQVHYIDQHQIMREDRFAFSPVPSLQASILDFIEKDPYITAVALGRLMNVGIEDVMTALTELGQAGYLEVTPTLIGDATQRVGTVTTSGKRVLDESVSVAKSFKIAYRYVVRDDAGAPIIPTTRPFCREMVKASNSRVWDATQITQRSLEENRNIWLRGGGFWTRKDTKVTTPYCRHEWEQVVIKERER